MKFFANGEEQALIAMPIAGLMSNERAEIVAAKADRVIAVMHTAGCTLNNAYMQHSLLAHSGSAYFGQGRRRCGDVRAGGSVPAGESWCAGTG